MDAKARDNPIVIRLLRGWVNGRLCDGSGRCLGKKHHSHPAFL